MSRIVDAERFYEHARERMHRAADRAPLVPLPAIYLTSVDTGFGMAPAVQSAILGAQGELLSKGKWAAEEGIRAQYLGRPAAMGRALEALADRIDSGMFKARLLQSRVEQPTELLDAAARYVFAPRGIPVAPENVAREVVACPLTSLNLHRAALGRFIAQGLKIIIPSPYFGRFTTLQAEDRSSLSRQLIVLPTEATGYRPVAAALDAIVREEGRDRIGALLLTHPNNFPFQALTERELQPLADAIVRLQLPVVCDELYAELERPGLRHVSLASMRGENGEPLYRHVLTTTGTSKLFNLDASDLYAGVACSGNHDWVAAIRAELERKGEVLTREAVIAGTAVFTHSDEKYRAGNRQKVAEASRRVGEQIAGINERLGFEGIRYVVKAQAAFYESLTLDPALLERHGIRDSNQLCEYVFLNVGVLGKPLTTLGTDVVGLRINLFGNTRVRDAHHRERQVTDAIARLEALVRAMHEGRALDYSQTMDAALARDAARRARTRPATRTIIYSFESGR